MNKQLPERWFGESGCLIPVLRNLCICRRRSFPMGPFERWGLRSVSAYNWEQLAKGSNTNRDCLNLKSLLVERVIRNRLSSSCVEDKWKTCWTCVHCEQLFKLLLKMTCVQYWLRISYQGKPVIALIMLIALYKVCVRKGGWVKF